MGKAIVNVSDVGESPSAIFIRQGSNTLPSKVMIHKVGEKSDWKQFSPITGRINSAGNLVVQAKETPHQYPTRYTDIIRGIVLADKQWGIEFLGSLAGVNKA